MFRSRWLGSIQLTPLFQSYKTAKLERMVDQTDELKQLGAALAQQSITVAPAAETVCAEGTLDL